MVVRDTDFNQTAKTGSSIEVVVRNSFSVKPERRLRTDEACRQGCDAGLINLAKDQVRVRVL